MVSWQTRIGACSWRMRQGICSGGGAAGPQTTLDLVAQMGLAHQLALPLASAIAQALRHDAPVVTEPEHLAVMEMVAPEFAEDGGAVATEPVRHVVGAHLRMSPALDPAALRKGEVRMLNLHSSVLSKPDALSRIRSGTPRKRVPRA